jgi:hypothetical protein
VVDGHRVPAGDPPGEGDDPGTRGTHQGPGVDPVVEAAMTGSVGRRRGLEALGDGAVHRRDEKPRRTRERGSAQQGDGKQREHGEKAHGRTLARAGDPVCGLRHHSPKSTDS